MYKIYKILGYREVGGHDIWWENLTLQWGMGWGVRVGATGGGTVLTQFSNWTNIYYGSVKIWLTFGKLYELAFICSVHTNKARIKWFSHLIVQLLYWVIGVGKVMGSILGQNRVIAKHVNSCTYCCYIRCATSIVWVGGMPCDHK